MYTLVGSRAMYYWHRDARSIKGADWDYFTPCEVGTMPRPTYYGDRDCGNIDSSSEYFDSWSPHSISVNGILTPVKLAGTYAGEGDGVLTYMVFEIDGRFFKQEGYYSSYDGNDWDGRFLEVKGVETTITEWRTL